MLSISLGNLSPPGAIPVLLAIAYLLLGCLDPLIVCLRFSLKCAAQEAHCVHRQALYPTLIIVLVSLEQSPLERGFAAVPRPTPLPLSSPLPSETAASVEGGGSTTVGSMKSMMERLPPLSMIISRARGSNEEGGKLDGVPSCHEV